MLVALALLAVLYQEIFVEEMMVDEAGRRLVPKVPSAVESMAGPKSEIQFSPAASGYFLAT